MQNRPFSFILYSLYLFVCVNVHFPYLSILIYSHKLNVDATFVRTIFYPASYRRYTNASTVNIESVWLLNV